MTGIYLEWLKLKKLSHLYEQQCTYIHKHVQSIVVSSIPIVIPLMLQSAMPLYVCMKAHVCM